MAALVTFVHGDQDPVDYTPSSDIAGGDVVVQNELVAVATRKIASGDLGSLATAGVWDFPKGVLSTDAIEAGKNVYWDAGNEVATETVGSNKLIGKVVTAATATATTVRAKLNQ